MKSSAQLWREIQQTEVSAGSLAFWWLYQAGIVLKSPAGAIVAVDPYLSESVMRSYKLPRGVPAVTSVPSISCHSCAELFMASPCMSLVQRRPAMACDQAVWSRRR